MRPVKKAVLRAPDGTLFHLSFEGDDLWVHVEDAPGGKRVSIDTFEHNAANEGWLRCRRRERVVPRERIMPRPLAQPARDGR